ncbi:hypothetical protein OF83DRAFT_1273179, partial [Amylostereum chailletii]
MTSSGGMASYRTTSRGPSLMPQTQLNATSIRTQAPESVWESGWRGAGGHGDYEQVGRRKGETLDGQKRWVSSSSSAPFFSSRNLASSLLTSLSMATTRVSLKAGGTAAAGRSKPMRSSSGSTSSWHLASTLSRRTMSAVQRIPPIGRRADSTPPDIFSSHLFPFPSRSDSSLQTSTTSRSHHLSSIMARGLDWLPPSGAATTGRVTQRGTLRAAQTERTVRPNSARASRRVLRILPSPLPTLEQSRSRPRPYRVDLVPDPSTLRPHCLARERLHLWRPADCEPLPPPFGPEDEERLLRVLGEGWQPVTLETYAAGLLTFHVICDRRGVSEADRAPASPALLLIFATTLAGGYAQSTVLNYIAGLRAWHILHRKPWNMDPAYLTILLHAADRLAPEASTRTPREPYTKDDLEAIHRHLGLACPQDAAVWACATSLFYGIGRTGELAVRRTTGTQSFKVGRYPTTKDVAHGTSRDTNQPYTVITLSCTKSQKSKKKREHMS